jgi:hypothetical protein
MVVVVEVRWVVNVGADLSQGALRSLKSAIKPKLVHICLTRLAYLAHRSFGLEMGEEQQNYDQNLLN